MFEARLSRPFDQRQFSVNEPAFDAAIDAVARGAARGIDVGTLRERLRNRKERLMRHRHAVQHRIETSLSLTQVLATDETSWFARPYPEHEALFTRLEQADATLFARVPAIDVRLGDSESERRALTTWEDWTAQGVDGMVVKSVVYQRNSRPGLVLPALACRGAEALRRLHGPEYDVESNLERLRRRSLSALRFRALGQFALGMEAVERFVEREPLPRRHLCVSAALALECQMSERMS
jgi:protein phosphatase